MNATGNPTKKVWIRRQVGRYRPPQKPGSKYITPEGHASLTTELDNLWRKRRPAVTKALSEAAAEGDRSENAEYIYRKKELREIDSRVRFLRKRLENIVIVDNKPADTNKIYFGANITLEDDQSAEETSYRIVGPDETDAKKNHISMDSPLGKALLGKQLDDEIRVQTPKGEMCYFIVEIDYEN